MPTDRDFIIVWPTVREANRASAATRPASRSRALRKCVEDVPRGIFRAWADADSGGVTTDRFASARLRARARAMPHNKFANGRVASDGSQEQSIRVVPPQV